MYNPYGEDPGVIKRPVKKDKQWKDQFTTLPTKTVRSTDPGSEDYPVLNTFGASWEMSNFDFPYFNLEGKTEEQKKKNEDERQQWVSAMQNVIAKSTFAYVREGGITTINTFDSEGNKLDSNALERAGFSVGGGKLGPLDPQISKRTSRLFRAVEAHGVYNTSHAQVSEFIPAMFGTSTTRETTRADGQWDGANLIAKEMLVQLTGNLDQKTRDRYLEAGRFSGTLMFKGQQFKGHWFVRDQKDMPNGSMLAVPEGSGKRQVSYDPTYRTAENGMGAIAAMKDDFYMALEPPIEPHAKINVDAQTLTSHYNYLFGNEQLMGWVKEESEKFVDSLRTGKVTDNQMKYLFADPKNEQAFENRVRDPLYGYLARGGDLRESPDMMRRFAQGYAQKLFNQAENRVKLPVHGGSRLYLASESVAGGLGLEQGQTQIDWKAGTIYVNSNDWERTAKTLGGADQDDAVNVMLNKAGQVLLTRNPNAQGEYSVFNLKNPDALTNRGVEPVDVDFGNLKGKITGFDDKQYGTLEKGQPPKNVKTYRQGLNWLTDEISKTPGILGKYINALTAHTLIEGKEPVNQPAASEDVVDATQKNLGTNLSPVANYISQSREELKGKPMPRDAARRLGLKEGQYTPAEGHWLDELQSGLQGEIDYVLTEAEKLANAAGPSRRALDMVNGADNFSQGEMLSSIYFESRRDGPNDQQRKALARRMSKAKGTQVLPSDVSNYDYAAYSAQEYLGQLEPEQRKQSILQAYTMPISPNRNLNDRFLFERSPVEGETGLSDYTFDVMERTGLLGKLDYKQAKYFDTYGDQTIESDAGYGTVSVSGKVQSERTQSLLVTGTLIEALGGNERANDTQRSRAMQGIRSFSKNIVGGVISLFDSKGRRGVRVHGATPKDESAPFKSQDADIGLVSLSQRGEYDDLISARVISSDVTSSGDTLLRISQIERGERVSDITNGNKEKSRGAADNYGAFADRVIAGEEHTEGLGRIERAVVDRMMAERRGERTGTEPTISKTEHNYRAQMAANYVAARSVNNISGVGNPNSPEVASEIGKLWNSTYTAARTDPEFYKRGKYDALTFGAAGVAKQEFEHEGPLWQASGEKAQAQAQGLQAFAKKHGLKNMWALDKGMKFESGRFRSGAPDMRPGDENLSVNIETPQGNFSIPEETYVGPDWSEVSPNTLIAAQSIALKHGGRVSGTSHTHPEGRGNFLSKKDKESLSRLGGTRLRAGAPNYSEEEFPGEYEYGEWNPMDRGSSSIGMPPPSNFGGGIPPNEPPPGYFPDVEPEEPEEPPIGGQRGRTVAGHTSAIANQVLESVVNRKSMVAILPPGWGKTDLARQAVWATTDAGKGGSITMVAQPYTSLAKSFANDMKKTFIPEYKDRFMAQGMDEEEATAKAQKMADSRVFFLPGNPGKGAPKEQMEQWTQAHESFKNAVYKSTYVNRQSGTREWKPGHDPIVGITTFQKAYHMDDTRLWKDFLGPNKNLISNWIVDEAHKTVGSTDVESKQLLNKLHGRFDGSILAMSGTLPKQYLGMMADSIGAGDNSVYEDTTMSHINFLYEGNVPDNQRVDAMADFAANNEKSLTYASTTRKVHEVAENLRGRGFGVDELHKGNAGGAGELSPEMIESTEGKLSRGELDPSRRYALSPAASHGINVKTDTVGYMGVPLSDLAEVTQIASRIRQDNTDPGKETGTFYWMGSKKDFDWAAKTSRNQIPKLNAQNLSTAFTAAKIRGGYDENWKVASQQIAETVGVSLKENAGISAHLSSIGKDVFAEAGLIRLGEGDEWEFADVAPDRVAQRLATAQYADPYNSSQTLGLGDYMNKKSGHLARQYEAMSRVSEQVGDLTPGQAGKVMKGALNSYNKGGVEGLERFEQIELPKHLFDNFKGSLEKATKTLESIGDTQEAWTTFSKSVKEITGQMQPATAMSGALQYQAMAQGASGSQSTAYSMIASSLSQRAMEPYTPASQGQGFQGASGGGDLARKLMYGAYMAKRIWQYTAAESFQDATYAAKPGYGLLTGSDESSLPAGSASMAARGRIASGEGTLRSFGGIMDFGNTLMSSNTNIASAAANLRVATGLGFGALEMGASMSQQGFYMTQPGSDPRFAKMGNMMAGVGGALTTLGIGAGIAIGAGGLAMDTYNQVAGLEGREAVGFGNIARNLAGSIMIDGVGAQNPQYQKYSTELWSKPQVFDYEGMMEKKDKYGITNKELEAKYGKDWVRYAQFDNSFKKMAPYRDVAGDLADKFGGTEYDYLPTLEGLKRGSNVKPEDMKKMLLAGGDLGYQPQEYGQAFASYADQMGIMPWSQQYGQTMQQFSQPMSAQSLYKLTESGQRNAQFSSQIAPYFSTSDTASQITSRYNLADPISMRTYQGLTDTVAQYADVNKVVGSASDIVYGNYQSKPTESYSNILSLVNPSGSFTQSSWFDKVGQSLVPAQSRSMSVSRDITLGEKVAQFQTAAGTDFNASVLGQVYAEPLLQAGMDAETVFDPKVAEKFKNYTPQQMKFWGQIMSGDLRAAGFAAARAPEMLENTPYGDDPNLAKAYTVTGRPMYEESGQQFVAWLGAMSNTGNQSAQQFKWANTKPQIDAMLSAGMPQQTAQGIQQGMQYNNAISYYKDAGVTDTQLLDSLAKHGTGQETQTMVSNRLYQYSMASIGIGMKQNDLTQNYYWGNNKGGSWDNPSEGSMWFLEDRMKDLQHETSMFGFSMQKERMDLSQQFAVQQEDLSFSRMQTNQGYQRYQQGFERQGMQMQREWQKEDWQYQDQQRSMQFGWNMEDIDEAIRYSGGRERRKLTKQRDRMVTSKNTEDEQVDTQRERQEKLWEREDERFNKQVEYGEKLIKLDIKQFELNRTQRERFSSLDKKEFDRRIKDYEEEKKIRDEMTELSRKYQYDQLMLQRQSLGIQAASLKLQHEMQLAADKSQSDWSKNVDEMEATTKYLGTATNSLSVLAKTLGATNTVPMQQTLKAFSAISIGQLNALTKFLNTLSRVK